MGVCFVSNRGTPLTDQLIPRLAIPHIVDKCRGSECVSNHLERGLRIPSYHLLGITHDDLIYIN